MLTSKRFTLKTIRNVFNLDFLNYLGINLQNT